MNTGVLQFDPIRLPPECQELREEVRAFLNEEIAAGTFDPMSKDEASSFNRPFGKRVAAKGWIGITWPKKFGGQERSFLDRYVITEEFRAVSAPTSSYFTADRQSGPTIMKYGHEDVQNEILPKIVSGDCTFCIGMSEPGSGSDLFGATTRATKTDGGYLINGAKIWTSNAHNSDYMIGLFRTAPPTKENRREGLTQFVVNMKTPGITINPVINMVGRHEFNEVVFEDAFVEDKYVMGTPGEAWKQATSELAYERSGPERFLETFYILTELVRVLGDQPDLRGAEGIGRLTAQLHTLRRMSVSVNGMLAEGLEPTLQGSIVKNLGTLWEQALPAKARDLAAFVDPDPTNMASFQHVLEFATTIAPKLTIQGGTTEVLNGIIARGLGLR